MREHVSRSRFFTYSEFVVSSQFPAMAHNIVLDKAERERIELGVLSILDPLRRAVGRPIRILSGVRSIELNRAVDGYRDSDHIYACAADIVSPTTSAESVFLLAVKLGLPYKQLIYYPKMRFVHVSWNIPGRAFKNEEWIER